MTSHLLWDGINITLDVVEVLHRARIYKITVYLLLGRPENKIPGIWMTIRRILPRMPLEKPSMRCPRPSQQ